MVNEQIKANLKVGQNVVWKQPYFGGFLIQNAAIISTQEKTARVLLTRSGMETDIPINEICYFAAYRQEYMEGPNGEEYLSEKTFLFYSFDPKEVSAFLVNERRNAKRTLLKMFDEFVCLYDDGRVASVYGREHVTNVQLSTTQTNK